VEKAKKILYDMNFKFEAGDNKMHVTSMAWHSLLDARSRKSPHENCIPRCGDLFQAIKELDRLGRPVADLRSWAYETLMRAWLRSGDPGALSEMESLYSYVMMNVSSTESRITCSKNTTSPSQKVTLSPTYKHALKCF
jgi:hypothetical protein